MRRSVGTCVFVRAILLLVCAVPLLSAQAQQPAAPAPTTAPVSHKSLTVDRIYGGPSVRRQLLDGLTWTHAYCGLTLSSKARAGVEAKNWIRVVEVGTREAARQ